MKLVHTQMAPDAVIKKERKRIMDRLKNPWILFHQGRIIVYFEEDEIEAIVQDLPLIVKGEKDA